MERKGGRGPPRAQGECPFLWIDLMEEQRSREWGLPAVCAGQGQARTKLCSQLGGSRPPSDDQLCGIHPPAHRRDPRGCFGAACFPGKDKQQVLGCSAPGALSCNRKSGSKSSLASAPPPENVTKQQGTTELSNVPLPKSAAATSTIW